MTTEKTIAMTRQTFVSKVMSLIFNMLSRLVITFLPRSKRLLISWLQSPPAVILLLLLLSRFSRVRLFATPRTAAHQASLFFTIPWSLFKLMSIESVMPSNHLVLCHPLLLLLSIFPRIRVFSNELVLHIRWPKYCSFSFSISPSDEHPGLISLQSKGLSRVFSNTTVLKHQFFSAQPFSQSNSHIHT